MGEALEILKSSDIKEIVCFGLGRFGECVVSRYQLALLLHLKDLYNVKVYVYDPIFSESERVILTKFNCEVLNHNSEGKHSIKDNESTLFYLPHCPKQLCNNLLWSNWGLKLSCCIIICNSFTNILEAEPTRILAKSCEYILNISPYVVELAVINNFKYHDIFNDTAIHIFPSSKISLIAEDFWRFKEEPVYPDSDTEFVTKKMSCVKI